MNSLLTPVEPTLPVAPWLGGKRNLARRICALIDALPCTTYAEPFVGMGGIFLRRSARPRAEVINDKGRDIANLFRILQRHYPQFLDTLRFQLTTRAEFNRLVDTNPDTLTDLERAGRFLLSLNDIPEVRNLFAAFHLTAVATTYTVGNATDRSEPRAELLISNRAITLPG